MFVVWAPSRFGDGGLLGYLVGFFTTSAGPPVSSEVNRHESTTIRPFSAMSEFRVQQALAGQQQRLCQGLQCLDGIALTWAHQRSSNAQVLERAAFWDLTKQRCDSWYTLRPSPGF